MYFVGIDIAKRFHEAAVIDEQGKVATHQISKFTRWLLQIYGHCQETESASRVCNGGDRALLVQSLCSPSSR